MAIKLYTKLFSFFFIRFIPMITAEKAREKDDSKQTNDSQFVALDDKINKNRGAPSNARTKRTRLSKKYFIALVVINLGS
jgi:hypothetical protein